MSEVKTNKITSLASNNDITLDPDGTGDVVVASGHKLGVGTDSPTSELTFGSNSTIEMVGGSSKLLFKRSDTTTIAGNPLGAIEFSHTDTDDAGTAAKIIGEGDGSSGEGRLAFHTGTPSSISERMRIDSSGKVGIGETSPLGTLHIRTSDASLTNINTNADDLILENNGNCGMSICSSTSGEGNINFIDSGDTNIGRIQYNHSDDQMDFRVNDTVRMCIRSGGEVNIGSGSSSPTGANQQIRFTVRQNQGTDAVFIDRTANIDSSFRDLVRFARNGTTVGQIKAKNTAVQYNTTSDARLKENIEDMTGAIDRIKTLKPKRYSWIADELDTPNADGFLAHEAQTVVPDAVSGTQNEVDDDGNPVYQGIDHGLLVPLLTGALKEAIAKIETLETKVAALEAGE